MAKSTTPQPKPRPAPTTSTTDTVDPTEPGTLGEPDFEEGIDDDDDLLEVDPDFENDEDAHEDTLVDEDELTGKAAELVKAVLRRDVAALLNDKNTELRLALADYFPELTVQQLDLRATQKEGGPLKCEVRTIPGEWLPLDVS